MAVKWGVCAAAAFVVASAAHAGIDTIEWTPRQIGALNLGVDGVWTEGDDYRYRQFDVLMIEDWRSGFGRHVTFDIGLGVGGERGFGANISFVKSLTNNTDFFWSSFEIVLAPDANSSLSGVTNMANAAFSDVGVTAGQNGAWILSWDQGTGTGVDIGQSTSLGFSFTVSGNFGFSMKQTPLPAPAGAALLGVAGLGGLRRRRAA